jgi:serine/threonine protein phosphatase PrpC
MKCGEPLAPGFAFCEACGARVGAPVADASAEHINATGADAALAGGVKQRCQCGSMDFEDGFCTACGLKLTMPDVVEVATFGELAASATHRGRRHPDNQDAVGIEEVAGGLALAVADGVSTSWQARRAADTAIGVALAALREPRADEGRERLANAVRQAHRAVCELDYGTTGLAEPQTTLVLALIAGEQLSYAWVGDSRLYLFDHSDKRLLTEDDSWLNEQIRAGVALHSALKDLNAHCITQCLGMRDAEPVIHTGACRLSATSWLLLCSDGLWNYFSEPAVLWTRLAEGAGDTPLSSRCVRLVELANAAGGQDNISVALYRSS